MALNRKYAALPDLDSAPDIYETPELTDDNSTIPASANRPQSDDEFDDADENETGGISRSRLRINEARSRFLPANADANGPDFSNRVDGKRMLYRAHSRRQRTLEDGTQELGDFSDDEDEEPLERRIARLRREVEEAKKDYDKHQSAQTGDTEHDDERLEALSRVLDDISKPPGFGAALRTTRPPHSEDKTVGTGESATASGPTYTVTYAPTYQQSHSLAKAADFDRRLVMVEQALGISSSSMLEAGRDGLPRAILPTLDTMDKQISTLSQASTANLDAISRRVRALATEQDKLNEAREKAKALREELGKNSATSPTDDSEHEAKVNALYGILPTIEGLTPMLSPLLDRLRSLRAIHADAATASQTLEHIETQQADMAGELKQWRDGLEKMEAAMRNGDAAVKDNVKVMEGWVKDLEERMAKLA